MHATAADLKNLTRLACDIIVRRDLAAARDFRARFLPDPALLPEAYALCAMPWGEDADKHALLNAISSRKVNDQGLQEATLLGASVGLNGFRFPQWRFPAMALGGQSMFAHYGMKKLQRATDHIDPALPDPQRDLYGAGFFMQRDGHYIEYRRAYVMIARLDGETPAAMVIRNSSYYYGRDRLTYPAYAAFGLRDMETLQNVTPQDFETQTIWHPLQDDLADPQAVAQLNELMRYFSTFDRSLHDWLWGRAAAAPPMQTFLQSMSALRHPVYLAQVDHGWPSWSPLDTRQITPEYAQAFAPNHPNGQSQGQYVLMSGRNGDFPA